MGRGFVVPPAGGRGRGRLKPGLQTEDGRAILRQVVEIPANQGDDESDDDDMAMGRVGGDDVPGVPIPGSG